MTDTWIHLKPSRINLGLTIGGAILAVILTVSLPLPNTLRASVLLLFSLALVWDLRLILLKGSHSVAAYQIIDIDPPKPADTQDQTPTKQPRCGIRIRYARADAAPSEAEGVICSGAFVTPWFTNIPYRLPGDPVWRRWWPHHIPLWADSLSADDFRHTRVKLKWAPL